MQLHELETVLQERVQKLGYGLSLLCQIPLLEAEYSLALPVFRTWLSDREHVQTAVKEYPLAFARMVGEITSRTFVPRTAIDQQGAGLWGNLRAYVHGSSTGSVIGSHFREAVMCLRRQGLHLVWCDAEGWRYVGPMLIHSGIPVLSVGIVLAALRHLLTWEPWQIDQLTGGDIEKALRTHPGLNKYTIDSLTKTMEGTLLVRQFVRLARFISDGGVLANWEWYSFSEPFVQELRSALSRGGVRTTIRQTWRAQLVWEVEHRFIGWLVPAKGQWSEAKDWAFVGGGDRRAGELAEMEGEVFPVRTGPEELLMDLVPDGAFRWAQRIPRAVDKLSDLMLFQNKTGHFLSWEKLAREGLQPGEYLALCRRGIDVERLVSPAGSLVVTETDLSLPGVWRRRYSGMRLEVSGNPGEVLTAHTGERQVIRVPVLDSNHQTSGSVFVEGHRQTFLSALHPAALGERMPVLTGEEFPTIRAWGRSFAQSPPGVRVLSWQHDGWAPVCGIEVAVEQGRDSCLFSLKGDGLRRVTTSGGYAVVRVELWDLSLHGRLLPPLYFLVFPGAKVETQVGLVPAREPGRLALSLSGPFVAHAGIGQVYMRRLGGRTQVVHQLPTGLRRGQLGLRSAMLPTADIIVLEWFSPGVPAATVAHAGAKQGQVPLCTQLPLPAIDLDDRTPWKGHESVLAWWPGLTASVIFGQEQRTLANISFARDATSRVYLGDVLSAATELVATDGQVEVSLRVGIYAWPLVCIRSQKRLAEMETERQRRRMPDSGELAHLLWACDLLMSGREATFPPIRADRSATALLQRLRELGEVSPAAKHMEARLRVWLLFHPDDLVFLDPGGRQR